MAGRTAALLMSSQDQPEDMPTEVEAVLESDKLFFLDPKHNHVPSFQRGLIPGEELPWAMPADATVVQVLRNERRFFVTGQHMLTIRVPDRQAFKPKKHRKHRVVDIAAQQRQRTEARKEKVQPVAATITAEERAERAEAERGRQAARRAEKQLKRDQLRFKEKPALQKSSN
jgi:hypothetical protein